MATGIAVNVGLNKVTSNVYTAVPLNGAEDDAIAMFELACGANGAGFEPGLKSPLLGTNANFKNVVDAIHDAASRLQPGDIFLFTFAGHGSTRVVPPGKGDPDSHDETIVLTDHMILDSFWQSDLWPKFNPGVRAVAIADCCHAKGVFTNVFIENIKKILFRTSQALGFSSFGSATIVRRLDSEQRQKELDTFPQFYASQLTVPTKPITVNRILLSACQANEDALEGPLHGAFTQALLDVWNGGNFIGNYHDFITAIQSTITGTPQHPDMSAEGPSDFTGEHPFQI